MALVLVEGHPFPDGRLRFRTGLPGMQVDTLVFQGASQPVDEDVVEESAFPIHRDSHARSAEPVGPGEGRELRSLICIHDLGRAEPVSSIVQRFDAEARLQRVRYPPGQYLAGVPVHDRHQIEEPAPHGQIGDVRTPTWVGRATRRPLSRYGYVVLLAFDISDLLLVEDQQTANRSLCQCPIFRE